MTKYVHGKKSNIISHWENEIMITIRYNCIFTRMTAIKTDNWSPCTILGECNGTSTFENNLAVFLKR